MKIGEERLALTNVRDFLADELNDDFALYRAGRFGEVRWAHFFDYAGVDTANPQAVRDFHNAQVDVFNGAWQNVTPPGAFVDPNVPDDYAPFGIQTIGSDIFVTYGKQDADAQDEVDGQSLGFVDEYDLQGNLVARVGSRASFATYLIPVVALILGVVFRDEAVHLLSVVGVALVIAGALLASRKERVA